MFELPTIKNRYFKILKGSQLFLELDAVSINNWAFECGPSNRTRDIDRELYYSCAGKIHVKKISSLRIQFILFKHFYYLHTEFQQTNPTKANLKIDKHFRKYYH